MALYASVAVSISVVKMASRGTAILVRLTKTDTIKQHAKRAT
jgi:hypothetical protein